MGCDVVSPWDGRQASPRDDDVSINRTEPLLTPWFDQPALQLLCLAYAQEMVEHKSSASTSSLSEPYLAFADLDESPPPPPSKATLWAALEKARANNSVGVRLFFDAELTCPTTTTVLDSQGWEVDAPYWCPASKDDWLSHCPHPSIKDPNLRRVHWKPIVLPERTYDLSPHSAVPTIDARPMTPDQYSLDPNAPLCLMHDRSHRSTLNATITVTRGKGFRRKFAHVCEQNSTARRCTRLSRNATRLLRGNRSRMVRWRLVATNPHVKWHLGNLTLFIRPSGDDDEMMRMIRSFPLCTVPSDAEQKHHRHADGCA